MYRTFSSETLNLRQEVRRAYESLSLFLACFLSFEFLALAVDFKIKKRISVLRLKYRSFAMERISSFVQFVDERASSNLLKGERAATKSSNKFPTSMERVFSMTQFADERAPSNFSKGERATTKSSNKLSTGIGDNNRKDLQIWIDQKMEDYLSSLAIELEASNFSEVIRRALRAREIFHPRKCDKSYAFDSEESALTLEQYDKESRRLTISLQASSVLRLERIKKETNKSFRAIIYEALLVFGHLNKLSKKNQGLTKQTPVMY